MDEGIQGVRVYVCVRTRGCVQGFDSGLCVKERERQRKGVKPGLQKAGGWMEAFEASKAFTQLLFKQRGKGRAGSFTTVGQVCMVCRKSLHSR